MLETPVVFFVFNRPDRTARVFERIRAARPRRLCVVSDGPRDTVPSDSGQTAAVRRLIEGGIDWPCELHRDYAERNLGCGPRVSSGLSAAFERYDRAIVLEDDTLPDASFFPFCEAMLERYAETPEVMHVSGANTAAGLGAIPPRDAYSFSRLPDIWGWATWSRAWRQYDFRMPDWETVGRTRWVRRVTPHPAVTRVFRGAFNHHFRTPGNPRSWCTPWLYACLRGGLSVTPGKNLISNIGFGEGSTNTDAPGHELSELPTDPIDTARLEAPPLEPDAELDKALMWLRIGCEEARRHASLAGRLRLHRVRRWMTQLTGR